MVAINKTTISPCIINSTKITRLLPNYMYVLHGFEMAKYKLGNKLCFQYLLGLTEIRSKTFSFKTRIVGLFPTNLILVNKWLVLYYANL